MTGNGPEAGDVVEQGGRQFPSLSWIPSPRWRPPRGAAVILAVGLIAGLAAGYAAGDSQTRGNASPSRGAAAASPLPSLAADSPALTQDTGECSAQAGKLLQLGVQVTNQSTAQLTLGQIKAVLPLGGLRLVSGQWAPCGTLPGGQGLSGNVLPPGASTWFSVTFKVLVACPSAFPVQFTVGYAAHGQQAAAMLPGFPDLGHVPYGDCPVASLGS